jgi:phosphatidylinositol alpha-1,6-mannosyltransferase
MIYPLPSSSISSSTDKNYSNHLSSQQAASFSGRCGIKILFISRAYPPIIGGIENQNWELGKWLGKIAEVTIIANKGGKKFLPFFLPYAALKSLFLARKYDAILLGDGVLGILAYKLKFFYPKKPVVCVVHGLDLTFKSIIYQKFWVNKFLKNSVDKFIAVGNETVKVAKEKGISENKIVFIPNGINTEKFYKECDQKKLEEILHENLQNKKIILTSGRLVKRKGVAWFIENVLSRLPENIIYIVAGDGPDKENIQNSVQKIQLPGRVKMLGRVSNETRNILFNTSDIFVQPNIKIVGNMEGFGLSVIEAASCKKVVLVSNIEGLKDAIIDGQNGFLVESGNAESWAKKINELLSDDSFRQEFGEKARQYVIDNFRWEIIAKKYLDEIKKTLGQNF